MKNDDLDRLDAESASGTFDYSAERKLTFKPGEDGNDHVNLERQTHYLD